ncbi:MAG: hypothetical protein L0241_30115, partial [Planctomycetia bacterium]|nr:hypothetical protein [Planctomycetia bacterium]
GAFGSAAGAYLFTFGLPLVAQLPHAQLYPRFLVPLAVSLAWGFLRNPRTWRLAVVAACGVAQVYLTVYIGYFLALLLATGGAIAVLRFRRELPWLELLHPGWRVWIARCGVGIAAVLAVQPLVAKHRAAVGPRPINEIRDTAPKLESWITPPGVSALFAEIPTVTRLETWKVGEQQLFPGVLTFATVLIGLVVTVRPGPFGGRGSVVAVAACSAVVLALFVTRSQGVWLYQPMAELPGVSGIRATGRIVLVLLFPASVVLAGCADVAAGGASRLGRFGPLVVALFAISAVSSDHWLTATDGSRRAEWDPMRYSKLTALTRQSAITRAIRQHPRPTVVYVFPSVGVECPGGPVGIPFEVMRASQDLGMFCVNGWSGYLPESWAFFANYRDLLAWFALRNLPVEQLEGLVVLGDPLPDRDPMYEAQMRAKYPPRPIK